MVLPNFFSNAIFYPNSINTCILLLDSLLKMISNIGDHSLSVFLSGWYSRVVDEGVQRKTCQGGLDKKNIKLVIHGNWIAR